MHEVRLSSDVRYWTAMAFGWPSLAGAVALAFALAFVPMDPPPWALPLFVAAFALFAWAATVIPRIRRARASEAGIHVSHGWRRGETLLPWARIRRMALAAGSKGASWRVDFAGEDGKLRHVYAPCWNGQAADPPSAEVRGVHALWSAAAPPVALRGGGSVWRLEAGEPGSGAA